MLLLAAAGDRFGAIGMSVCGALMAAGLAGMWLNRRRGPFATPYLWGILLFAVATFVGAAKYLLASSEESGAHSLLTWMQFALMGCGAALTAWSSFVAVRISGAGRQRLPFGRNAPTPYTGDSNEGEAHP